MKATEQYFPVALIVMLYKVVLTFESVGEILRCDDLKLMKVVYHNICLERFIILDVAIQNFIVRLLSSLL